MNADKALVLRRNIWKSGFSREVYFATCNDVPEVTPEILLRMELDEVAALNRCKSLKNCTRS
jgi:hypothetical protein